MGRDGKGAIFVLCVGVSIHAPAWGATGRFLLVGAIKCCFNPRARMGRDVEGKHLHRKIGCFNPRARMGRDFCDFCVGLAECRFNPRARMGRDSCFWPFS